VHTTVLVRKYVLRCGCYVVLDAILTTFFYVGLRRQRSRTTLVRCTQLPRTNLRTPLLPPSHNDKAEVYYDPDDPELERKMLKLRVQYRRLVEEEKKKRKYLEGALMRELPGAGYYRIDAMKGRAVLDIDSMREKAHDRTIGRRNFYCDHIYDREILDMQLGGARYSGANSEKCIRPFAVF